MNGRWGLGVPGLEIAVSWVIEPTCITNALAVGACCKPPPQDSVSLEGGQEPGRKALTIVLDDRYFASGIANCSGAGNSCRFCRSHTVHRRRHVFYRKGSRHPQITPLRWPRGRGASLWLLPTPNATHTRSIPRLPRPLFLATSRGPSAQPGGTLLGSKKDGLGNNYRPIARLPQWLDYSHQDLVVAT